jgi:hypothetical protein
VLGLESLSVEGSSFPEPLRDAGRFDRRGHRLVSFHRTPFRMSNSILHRVGTECQTLFEN